MARLIRVASGIGDNVWLLQKLINAGERFDFHLSSGLPQRGKQLFDLLPQVANSCEYVDGLPYKTIRKTSECYDGVTFRSITDKAFSLAVNHHLESGKRIEEFLPDLPMTYELPYQTGSFGKLTKEDWLPDHPIHIGIYISSYHAARSWDFWNERGWFDLIYKLHLDRPEACFVFIGASWDIDLTDKVRQLCINNKVPVWNGVGLTLSATIETLRYLDYFIGFPSGMCMVNESLHKKTFMFYPYHLKHMMYAWAEEDRIKNLDYIAQLFCTPLEAYYLIKDKSGVL